MANMIVSTRDAQSATSTLLSMTCCLSASIPRGLSWFALLSAMFSTLIGSDFAIWIQLEMKDKKKSISTFMLINTSNMVKWNFVTENSKSQFWEHNLHGPKYEQFKWKLMDLQQNLVHSFNSGTLKKTKR